MILRKNNENRKIQLLIIIFLLCFQGLSFAQTKTVDQILMETQNTMKANENMRFDMHYKWYNTYTEKSSSITYQGNLIKFDKIMYSKINNTFFISDTKSKTSIKCNEEEKALVVQHNTNTTESQSPIALLDTFIKFFKTKEVKDNGDQWICVLTTDVITQLPYGKVEIFINKETALIEKQILYFLSNVPYKNEDGEEKSGNPKMEITLSNFENKLSENEKSIAQIDYYIQKKGTKIIPTTAYKEFKISQY